ncbi:iron chelate uptake ABC transporter family permease subunit [Actinoplanes sp. N902-109]|uniref:FecCD family ABC transporter permease n=1 Tax=Actinoplanes sp. (strain N902-109) TaxID=649831 RepID=UPI0003296545|nr:iron chelate uptake ABC transporter family permease subunit [Actinoplanes sp. N902-109]AGL15073.1 ferric enterobactin transport system permease protein FepG [Actinoplanes sp. N902-109]
MSIDFGRRVVVLRPTRHTSARISLKPLLVTVALTLAALAVGVLALGTGEFTLSPAQVVEALAGEGTRAARLVVVEWRLPRVLLALILGAALGLSGAIFQALTRNPLGSPDVIGFNTGAYTGVLIVTVLMGNGYYLLAGGALVGGLATAAVVYLLAFSRGVQGFRLIIVGIAVSAMLASANQWFITTMDLQAAYAAALWGQGSLNGLGWAQVTPAAVAVGALCLALLLYGPRLAVLEMGEDAAAALGVRVQPVRLAYLVIGVALTAVATATAGPVSFVALAAPQLAQRLTRTPGIALLPSAAMGAFLLMLSDWLAQRVFAPTQLPVGVVTVAVGGLYFVWLLIRQARR